MTEQLATFVARIGNWPNPESILYAEGDDRFYRYDYDTDSWTIIGFWRKPSVTVHVPVTPFVPRSELARVAPVPERAGDE